MMTLVYKYEILFHAKLIDNEANKLTKKKRKRDRGGEWRGAVENQRNECASATYNVLKMNQRISIAFKVNAVEIQTEVYTLKIARQFKKMI